MSILDTLKDFGNKIKDFFTDIPGKLGQLWEDIKNIPTNIANWATEKKDAIVNWKDEKVQGIKDTFNNVKDTITNPAKLKEKFIDLWTEFKKEPVTNTLKAGLILSFLAIFVGQTPFIVMGAITLFGTLGVAGFTEGKKVYDKWQGKKNEREAPENPIEPEQERGRSREREEEPRRSRAGSEVGREVGDRDELQEQGRHARQEEQRRHRERGHSR